MKKFLCLSLLALTSFSAFAGCNYGDSIDLRKVHGKVMSNIQIKNQGDYGLCYAYSGSMLVDFFRMKNGGGNSETSPLESGLLSAIYSESESEEGGDICDVVNSLSQRGKACPISAITTSESRYKDIGLWFHTQVVSQVFMPYITQEKVFKSVAIKNFRLRQGLTTEQKSYLSRFDLFYQSLKAELSRKGFKASDVPSALDVFKFSQAAHSENKYAILSPSFTQMLIAKSCEASAISVPKLKCETRDIARADMIDELDHQLENFKKPVGISYCSRVLSKKSANGIDYYNKPRKNCAPHASVVIGKRADTNGKCQYLIRNSWGRNHKYPWETSQGDIWLSEEAMMLNVYKLHIVQ